MKIDGWTYYNHAAVPTTAPNEETNMAPINDGSIWNISGGTPLLARWTTDFDCGYETNWWYVIKDAPFDVERLDSKVRKHIRQSLKKVYVKQIRMAEYADELCVVHNNACRGYSDFTGTLSKASEFAEQDAYLECWAAFSTETDVLVGFLTCELRNGYVETVAAKYDPQYLNLRASDAIHYTILEHYLNQEGYAYVCSGCRTINHATNAQEYKITTFGFRKAYCILHVAYRPKVKWIVQLLYPVRRVLSKLDGIGFIHQVNSILLMEEMVRKENG